MMIYAALLLPPVITAITAFLWPHKVKLWELLVPIGAGTATALLTAYAGTRVATTDTEFWNGFVVKAEYYEDWNETVPCSHIKWCTDSKGNSYACGTQHTFDVDYHPERWELVDTNGISVVISKEAFELLCKRFQERKFVDLHRNYYTDDGDKYETNWNGERATARLVVTEHWYTNKVAASDAIVRWPAISPERMKKLHAYAKPDNGAYAPSLMGWADPEAKAVLDYTNGAYGAAKQLRLLVLVFQGQPLDAALEQEYAWRGGNKNELVLCVGLDADNGMVQWGYAFSWTDDRTLVADVSGYVNARKGQEFNCLELVQYLENEVPPRWVRKHFEDFDWIWIDPPWWAIILTYLCTIIASCGAAFWVVVNEEAPGSRYGLTRIGGAK